MNIPFTIEEFLNVFRTYNESLWPIQIALYSIALIAFVLVFSKSKYSSRIVSLILALLWTWMGVVYHIIYFAAINKAAYVFGGVFLLQASIFLYFGVFKQSIQLEFKLKATGVIALILIAYSLILYPLIGRALGHVYPQAPTFGVPCPTTIFTFGILLYSVHRIPWYIVIIPLLWSIVGFSAAMNLGIQEDYGLVIAGLLSTAILLFGKPKPSTTATVR